MTVASLALVASLGIGAPAQASPCDELSADAMRSRVEYINKEIEAHEASSERWFFGYGLLYIGLSTGLAVRLNAEEETKKKQTNAVGIVGNVLGMANLMLVQPTLLTAREKIATRPAESRGEIRAKLEFAESLYRKAVKDVDRNTGWLSRLTAGLYSLSASLFVFFVIKDRLGALQQGIGGLLIGQSRAVFYPEGIKASYDKYRARYETCVDDPRPINIPNEPPITFEPNPTGFVIRF